MPKYYVAGIPFDSENALQHYGVKGMKWDQHIFGPDANTKYINWMDVGKLASSKRPSNFTDTGSNRSGVQQNGPGIVRSALDKGAQLRYKANQAANQAGKALGSAATSVARAAGGALNAGTNFITGNDARKGLSDTQRSYNFNKKQLVNNARLYNQGKANVANATNMANEATQRYITSSGENPEAQNNLMNDLNRAAELTDTGNKQMQTSTDKKNDIMDKTLAARNNMNQAQNAYDNTLPGFANRVGQGAKGFIDNAGRWISGAAGDIAGAATNAWNGISGAANAAGDWIGNAANDVGNFFTGDKAKQNLIDAQRRSVDSGNRGKGPAVDAAQNAYNRTAPGFINSAGQWISNAAGNVGKAAQGAWNDVKGAANQAGQWIGDSANNVRDFFVGNPNDQNASRMMRDPDRSNNGGVLGAAGQWIGDRAQDVGNAANQAWNGVSGAASQAGQWIGDTAQKAWESPWVNPVKAINVAGDWIGDRAGDVAGAATDAWNGVSGAAGNVRDFFVGNPDEQNAARMMRNPERANQRGFFNQAGQWISDRAGDVAGVASNAWNGVSGAANRVGETIGNAASDVGNFITGNRSRDEMARAMSNPDAYSSNQERYEAASRANDEYNRTLPGMAGQARNWATGVVNDVSNSISEPARQRIQDDYQREIDNVVNRINQRYGYEPGSTSFLGNEKAFTEYQQGISDAKAKYERELEDLKRNPIGGAIGNLFHSAIDDKPEGVTDTFWKNYVASGGTREQYERDWR